MITRVIFTSTEEKPFFKKRNLAFSPVAKGFAKTQGQKNVRYMHDLFMRNFHGNQPLEISTASTDPNGVKLSAFNLIWNRPDGNSLYVENIFQASKTFENGGPYLDLLDKKPGTAKKDDRLHTSGSLKCFTFEGREYPTKPTNAFYDWIYINALVSNKELAEYLLKFTDFSDYYFNPDRSLNCQAQAAAIFVGSNKAGKFKEAMKDFESFVKTIWEV